MSGRRPAVLISLMGLRNAEGIAEGVLHRWDCSLITCEPSTTLFTQRSIPHEPLWVEAPRDGSALLRDVVDRVERAAAIVDSDAFRDAYRCYDDHVWPKLRDVLMQVLRCEVFAGMAIVDAFRRAAEAYDIRVVVVSEDHRRDNRTLVALARAAGIPILQVIHSVPTGSTMPLEPVTTEYAAVFSEHTREQYLRLGAKPESMVITGNPAWDAFLRPPLPNHRRDVCRAMGLDSERPIVTYAITATAALSTTFAAYPRHHLELAEAVTRQFVTLSRVHPEWQFLLRPRPGLHDAEPFETMLAAMPAASRRTITLDRNSPYNAMVVSDVVLSTQSNMGIEAILMGKPSINVDIEAAGSAIYREGLGPLFDERDAVVQARTEDEIGAAIERALTDRESQRRFFERRPYSMRKFNGACDGRATERVVELIVNLGRAAGGPHPFYATELGLRADADRYNAAGEDAFARGELHEAVRAFTEAASRYRRDARIVNNLATATYACGDERRAWHLLLEAFHHDPWYEPVRENLLALGATLGDEARARALLETFGCTLAP